MLGRPTCGELLAPREPNIATFFGSMTGPGERRRGTVLLEGENAYAPEMWPSVVGVGATPDKSSALTGAFFPVLYVGESKFGLYAINTLVDQHTITYSPKLLGPPLLEGPSPIALSDEEKSKFLPHRRPIVQENPSITYKTHDGEYLVFGYHESPKNVHGRDNSNEHRQITGPKIEDVDTTPLFDLVLQIYQKYPQYFIGTAAAVVVLLLTTVWMCGKQWGASSFAIAEARSAQTSRQSNNGRTWAFTRSEELPDGWMNVGKLQYNPTEVLGRGCEGTVVYRGKFDGREVAVKRVVSEFVRFVDREADLLRESDTHPHVIRYFCMEADSQFRYLALELCVASLNDFVEHREVQDKVEITQLDILRQATDGLAHLHASKIVHRDMKPQNVLITMKNQRGHVRAVISDFGLCKRIQPGRNSLSRGLASGLAGTEGWIAPEALVSASTSYPVDVFSLGCIFYYVLSNGAHPFGRAIQRQANIVNGDFSLAKISETKDGSVSEPLIKAMLESDPAKRPPASTVLNHPFFWSSERRLAFFGDVSDRVEKEEDCSTVVRRLETDARAVVCGGWREKICDPLKEDLRKFRTYKSHSVRDLLRAMRNKKHHYRELPEAVRQSMGHIPEEFLHYFTSRFPKLLLHAYTAMEWCASEPVFRGYYSDQVREAMASLVEEDEKQRKENATNMASVWVRGQVRGTPETKKKVFSTPT
ncbi:unnamed protein product [Caenorhabditis auriculariae]|uniref:non-specific serine/threonine protein kinase n=1 Tax=Caenorhabditis auriculariae TaxID=2777116 RepID=A0A8S1H8C1_9PELO|nr:unnamed protein product [Caenorhabditis auriculariae]